MQTVVGLLCVALGCLHFAKRDREPQERSLYFGSLTGSVAARSVLAMIEVVAGLALLFTA